MMKPEDVKNVGQVYRHFIASETNGWDKIDDHMVHLDYLTDDQLHREADVIYCQHKIGKPGCGQAHPSSQCFITNIVEAVGSILELYKESDSLHPKNRYILQYYLAIAQEGVIKMMD